MSKDPNLSNMTFAEIEALYGEEAAIQAGIAADPDTFELDAEWFKRARPAREAHPEFVERWERRRDAEQNISERPAATLSTSEGDSQ